MKRRWLFACVFMTAIVLLASCTKTTTDTTQGTTETGVTEPTGSTPTTPTTPTPTVPTISKPVYGGALNIGISADVPGFDNKFILSASTWTLHLTNEKPVLGDWAKGPAGTGEDDWILPGVWTPSRDTNVIITGWEAPDSQTIILHVRKGIFFHNKPPANGREMDATDVAYSIERSSLHEDSINFPTKPADRITSIATPDKWTVVVKVPEHTHGAAIQTILTGLFIFPKELGRNGTVTDWKNAIGTGPYILTDYVKDSAIILSKNENYWRYDPVYPNNKLPYTDKVKALVLADISTQMAAIRTGRIDVITGVEWDTGRDLLKTNPELQSKRYLRHTSTNVFMRMDKTELPYDDIKVRRALMMAIDYDAIVEGIYQGNAEKFTHPVCPIGAVSDMFVPLDKMPLTVQENYSYNVEKAKQLLKEAGYSTGFQCKITCTESQVDEISVILEFWKAIGVIGNLDVRETGTWTSIQRSRSQEDMIIAPITNIYYYQPLAYLADQKQYNRSWGSDQYIEDYYNNKMLPLRGPTNDAALRQAYKELVPYLADLVWLIPLPTPYFYTMWQPWLGGYHGEYSVGAQGHGNWPPYVWINTDVKQIYYK